MQKWQYFCKKFQAMKVKLPLSAIKAIISDPEGAETKKFQIKDPWWVILLKVIAYAIGLILAGITTSCTASALNII